MAWERENAILNPHGITVEGPTRLPTIIDDAPYEVHSMGSLNLSNSRWYVNHYSTWWYDEAKLGIFIERLSLMRALLTRLNALEHQG